MNKNFDDFKFFTDPQNEVSPSDELDRKVLAMTKEAPAHPVIFGKLLGTQVFVGALTLLICPQFDLGLGKSFQIFRYIHHTLGMEACYAFCGAIFMGPSALLSLRVLKENELDGLGKLWPMHFLLLAATMLVALSFFGTTVSNQLLFIWFFTATVSSVGLFAIGKRLMASSYRSLRP